MVSARGMAKLPPAPILSRFGTARRQPEPVESKLKHPVSQQLHAYWNEQRGRRLAPERADIDPGAIRRVLGDSLVLSCEAEEPVFRLAGTRLCAVFGRELRDEPFTSIWDIDSAPCVRDVVGIVAEEGSGLVAAASATSGEDRDCNFEMLLLPLMHRGRLGLRFIGSIAPHGRRFWLGIWPAASLHLGTIRYIRPDADPAHPLRRGLPSIGRPRSLKVIEGGRP
jgi:hypothetical protein